LVLSVSYVLQHCSVDVVFFCWLPTAVWNQYGTCSPAYLHAIPFIIYAIHIFTVPSDIACILFIAMYAARLTLLVCAPALVWCVRIVGCMVQWLFAYSLAVGAVLHGVRLAWSAACCSMHLSLCLADR
jgi:hypothetical protein